MHPGFAAYSPETLLQLRSIAGPNVGCNDDPSPHSKGYDDNCRCSGSSMSRSRTRLWSLNIHNFWTVSANFVS
jgi:hypothetical protein